ncbi:ADP-ribosyltransferase [Bacillus thuringiensis]|uniref:ADP-ribosyltransferase n=1 Tax=Bacillus thuringiensis TaxID=1428 RepID=UPI003459AAF3
MCEKIIMKALLSLGVLASGFTFLGEVNAQGDTDVKTVQRVSNIIDFSTNTEKAKQWANKSYSTWIKNLSSDEQTAVHLYTQEQYVLINQWLRGSMESQDLNSDDNEMLNFFIRNIDSALSKAKTPETVVLYRRASVTELNVPGIMGDLDFRSNSTLNATAVKKITENFLKKPILKYNQPVVLVDLEGP